MPSSSKYSAIKTESAQSDSTEVAYDISAMKVMTAHKASTNQKHGSSANLHNESLKVWEEESEHSTFNYHTIIIG